ncbi:MAG: flavin reductase family protein [Chloroflexi bacterium]|nr:flavin reductase family protein [Chloroflexota bacterium]
MSKGFTPIYVYPTEKTGFFRGEKTETKLIKDIKGVAHSDYGGWWPSFFPTTIAFLVTGSKEKPNVMTVSCITVVNAYPFMIGFPLFSQGDSTRGSGPRYSLELIRNNPEFTINVPYIDKEMTKKTIICGSFSGRDGVDKIAKAGFTPLGSHHVSPPILKECPLNLECRVHLDIPLGGHTWIIGQVEAVHMDERLATGEDQFVWRSMPELIRGGK